MPPADLPGTGCSPLLGGGVSNSRMATMFLRAASSPQVLSRMTISSNSSMAAVHSAAAINKRDLAKRVSKSRLFFSISASN